MTIKAIETSFKGCRFRSRLEARWAVWLDALQIAWRYEHQGFVLDGEAYLPDFWLPFRDEERFDEGMPPVKGYWLEIKPQSPTEREKQLLLALAKETHHHAYAFLGSCGVDEFSVFIATAQGSWIDARDNWPEDALVHESRGALRTWHELYGLFCNTCSRARGGSGTPDCPEIEAAFAAARSARFEHGEKPR
jgi:hypothetical protein